MKDVCKVRFRILLTLQLVLILVGLGVIVKKSDSPSAHAIKRFVADAAASVASLFGGTSDSTEGALAAEKAAQAASEKAAAKKASADAAKAAAEKATAAKAKAQKAAEAKRKAAQLAKAAEEARRKKAAESGKALHIHGGGKSKVTMGANGLPHVASVGGLEFGSDTGLDARLQPWMTVKETAEGLEFGGLVWRSDVAFDDGGIYGFEKAWLTHSYDSKELASITLHKDSRARVSSATLACSR